MPPEQVVASGIVLMRHGETAWNRERRVMGRADIPINEDGVAQSRAAAEVLAGFGIGRIVSSPLLRARQTADLVAERIGVDVELVEDLEEVRFGAWQGMTYSEVRKDPSFAAFIADPLDSPTPGGETIRQVQDRGMRIVETIKPGKLTLMVSHGDIIRTVIAQLLGVPLEQFRRIRVDNAGLSGFALAEGKRPEMKFVNMLADPGRAWHPLHWGANI